MSLQLALMSEQSWNAACCLASFRKLSEVVSFLLPICQNFELMFDNFLNLVDWTSQ